MTRTQAEAARICSVMSCARFGDVMIDGSPIVPDDVSSNQAAISLANKAFVTCNRGDCMTTEEPHFGSDWAEAESRIQCGFR